MNTQPEFKYKPKLSREILKEAYSHFPNFLFFTTIKPGERDCYCTACKGSFKAGIHTLHRTHNLTWAIADSVRHKEVIKCPVCGAQVKAINTKLQLRLKEPNIKISEPTAFFYGISERNVWICCYFINRTYSYNGRICRDEQNETNVYHLSPENAEYFRRWWSPYYGWDDKLCYEYNFREPFRWDSGLSHIAYDNYSFVYATKRKLIDTFLRYSGFEEYQAKYPNAPMFKYWCWYCIHPQLEMLSKFGFFGTVNEMLYCDADLPTCFNWNAKKPWELYRLTKSEYNTFLKIHDYNRIKALRMYKALKVHDTTTLELCGKIAGKLHTGIQPLINYCYKLRKMQADINRRLKEFVSLSELCYGRFKDTVSLECKILKYGRTVKEAIKYFERISLNSAGHCWHCPGITTREVVDLWIDYINMGDTGKRNFNPFPSDLKGAHDILLEQKAQRTAAERRKEAAELARKLAKKYPNVNKHCRALKAKYYYDNGTYAFVVPKNITDILVDGYTLNQCTVRSDASGNSWRYFDRINKKETYIGFVRKSGREATPWFTVEFEPGGTVRQKRAENDSQPAADTALVSAFLSEWQAAITARMDNTDIEAAKKAKIKRLEEFEDLRKTKKTINYGELSGTLLIDAFEKDLMEIEIEIA